MRPRFFPSLVNDRYGDPALFIDFLHEKRAMLFDLGDLQALPARNILRLSDIFVSHTHIDHFIGFDRLLRLLVGREKRLRLYGPAGFIDRVQSKLGAYTWNLAESFRSDLMLAVTEIVSESAARRASFRLKRAFAPEAEQTFALENGLIFEEASLSVSCAVLEHRTPCLGFALQETAHVNVWKNRLDERRLAVGPWLRDLKAAVLEGRPDDTPIRALRRVGETLEESEMPIGALRGSVVSVTPGRKIGYITDAAYTEQNKRAIVDLANGADILFIEAAFRNDDASNAAARAHLTTGQAGALAREAGVKQIEPFHFSSRYAGEEAEMLAEVDEAFRH